MKTKALTLTRIGKSQAVCLPAGIIRKEGSLNCRGDNVQCFHRLEN